MTVERLYTFRILDDMNEWVCTIQLNAPDEETARRRADHFLFSRREVRSVDDDMKNDGRIDLILVPSP